MIAVTVTIGLTITDRAADYIPTMDGYKMLAAQDEVAFEYEVAEGTTVSALAEVAFKATNAPAYIVEADPETSRFFDALAAKIQAEGLSLRSISTGDTVAVKGTRTAVVKCERMGWTPVFPAIHEEIIA